jgi:hypothetical protein
MRTQPVFVIVLALGTLGVTDAQTSAIGAPLTGFLVDSRSHSIRPIQGIPGASMMGDPLTADVDVRTASFSSTGQFGLTADARRGLVLVNGLGTSAPSTQVVQGAISGVELMSLNDAGSAVLYSRSTSQVQFLKGLPDNPVASSSHSVSSLPGTITALAIAADGSTALAASSDGTYGGIYEISNSDGATPQSIVSAFQPSAVSYLNNDQDAVLADSFTNEVDLIQGVHGSRTRSVMVSSRDGVQNPIALQPFNGLLLIASAGSQNVIGYDLAASRVLTNTAVPIAPVHFGALNVRGVFSLNDSSSLPSYLYSAADASVLFVPPDLPSPVDRRRTLPSARQQGGSAQ